MTLPRLRWLALSACLVGPAHGASLESRVETLFRPAQGGRAALSPDGQQLAYTVSTRQGLSIVIVGLEPPGPRRTVPADPHRAAEFASGLPPVGLRFLRWATPRRLVFAPDERVLPLPPVPGPGGHPQANPDGPRVVAPVLAVDADGRQRGVLVDARDFMTTSAEARTLADLLRTPQELTTASKEPVHWRMPHLDVLGFLPGDREQLVVGTRGGFGPPGRHLVDVRTGEVRGFGGDESSPPGEREIYDWHRLKVVGERTGPSPTPPRWRDDELAFVQRELERKFPRRSVELLDWSETRLRVLFRVAGGHDPGRVFVWQRPEDVVVEVMRVAPWLAPARLHETRAWAVPLSDGGRLEGFVTWPRPDRTAPSPLLLVFAEAVPTGNRVPAFDAEAQVFADLGFAVARLWRRSEAAGNVPESGAFTAAAVQEAIARLAEGDPARPVDRRQVVAFGRGSGAMQAVQVAQVAPEAFRAVVALEPRDGARLALSGSPPPVLLLGNAVDGLPPMPADWVVERDELPADFAAGEPAARAAAYRRIEAFLARRLAATETPGPAAEVAR